MNNSTGSNDTELSLSDVDIWLRAVQGCVVGVLLGFSLVGNGIALFLICRYKQLRYRSILAAVGLMVVDLLMPVALHLPSLASIIAGMWPFGDIGCTILGYVLLSLLQVRWLEATVVVLDRFLVIVFPFFYMRWSKHILIALTVAAWLIPFAIFFPAAVGYGFGRFTFRTTTATCAVFCGEDQACYYFYAIEFSLFVCVGGLLPTVLYFILYCIGRRKSGASIRTLGTYTSDTQAETRKRSRTLSFQTARDRRATVTFAIVFFTLLVTQLPELIFSVTRRTDLYSLIPIFVHFIAIDIYLISPALDPVVIMRNRDFRNAMARMLGHRAEASHGIAPLPVQHYNLPPLPST